MREAVPTRGGSPDGAHSGGGGSGGLPGWSERRCSNIWTPRFIHAGWERRGGGKRRVEEERRFLRSNFSANIIKAWHLVAASCSDAMKRAPPTLPVCGQHHQQRPETRLFHSRTLLTSSTHNLKDQSDTKIFRKCRRRKNRSRDLSVGRKSRTDGGTKTLTETFLQTPEDHRAAEHPRMSPKTRAGLILEVIGGAEEQREERLRNRNTEELSGRSPSIWIPTQRDQSTWWW